MFDCVKKSILKFGNFSEEQLHAITSRLKILDVKKETIIIKEGQICSHFYFIENGSFKITYSISQKRRRKYH